MSGGRGPEEATKARPSSPRARAGQAAIKLGSYGAAAAALEASAAAAQAIPGFSEPQERGGTAPPAFWRATVSERQGMYQSKLLAISLLAQATPAALARAAGLLEGAAFRAAALEVSGRRVCH